MFVISECWQNILADPSKKSLTLEEKMGRTLKHAGVSITVTSLTDILAFSLGSFTVGNKNSVIHNPHNFILVRLCLGLDPFVSVQPYASQ